ncbi:MAG: hypothetical protein LAP40_20380 [Acidobacteriia bacterium]|nr:hypothetical protein [Terriglobia bacterium]
MELRLLRPGKSQEETPARHATATTAQFLWTPLRWLRDAAGLLGGAVLLAWLIVHFSK